MPVPPFATPKLIEPGANDPRIKPRVAVLHVDAGGVRSLFSFFKYRSGGIESHFHIRWTGEIECYRDTDWQADANHLANDFGISIETQGFGGGKWNRRQLKAVKALLLWLHETHGIPLRKVDRWDGSGIGYHVQFGAPGPWTPVAKSCPGPERIRQFDNDLVPWMATALDSTEEPTTMNPRDIFRYRLRKDGTTFADVLRQVEKLSADVAAIRAHLEQQQDDTEPSPKA